MNSLINENQSAEKARIIELNAKVERIEERYILEEITGELYQKYKQKFEIERDEIEGRMMKNTIELSKLDVFIRFTFKASENLRQLWQHGNHTQRQELQIAFFSEGVGYNRKEDKCRLEKPNYFLETVADFVGGNG